MGEAEPIDHERLAERSPWLPPALPEVLGADPVPSRDLFLGEGQAYVVGPNDAFHLALYPEHRAVELTTPNVIVSFRKPCVLRTVDAALVVDSPTEEQLATLVVRRDGTASLLTKQRPPAPPRDAEGVARPLDRVPPPSEAPAPIEPDPIGGSGQLP